MWKEEDIDMPRLAITRKKDGNCKELALWGGREGGKKGERNNMLLMYRNNINTQYSNKRENTILSFAFLLTFIKAKKF